MGLTEQLRAGGVARIHAVARKLGILSSLLEAVDTHSKTISDSLVDFQIRRNRDTRADTAGLVRYRFNAGEVFGKGDPHVNVVFPTDDHLKTGTADRDSYVIGQAERLASHEGDPVASTAIRGEADLVVVRDD